MNKKHVFFAGLLASFMLVGCSNDKPAGDSTPDKPSTPDTSSPVEEVVVPTSIEVDGFHINVLAGKTFQLGLTFTPADANKDVDFTFADEGTEDIATISETGLITANKAGSSKIIVSSKHNSEVKDEFILHIGNIPESIHVYDTDDSTKAKIETATVTVDVPTVFGVAYNGEAAFYGMTFSSSDETKVKVEDNNGSNSKIKVTGLEVGASAVITVKSSVDETKIATLTVTVEAADVVVPLEGTKFDFGTDKEASTEDLHVDGTEFKAPETFTSGESSLVITPVERAYKNAFDVKGKAGLKLGGSKKAGSFTFTVDEATKSLAIWAGKYRGDKPVTLTVKSGETEVVSQALESSSQDGMYDQIIIDCSTLKTFTVSVNNYARIDAIVLSTEAVPAK